MQTTKKESLRIYGQWRLTAYYKGTKKVAKVIEGENLIVTAGKALLGDMLIDVDGYDTGLTYCVLGANNGAPAVGETELVDEGGGAPMRKTITSRSRDTDAGVVTDTLSTFFTAAECTLAILEAAIFGHSSAGPTENSGIMFSRWLVAFDNSGAGFDISIDYDLIIG